MYVLLFTALCLFQSTSAFLGQPQSTALAALCSSNAGCSGLSGNCCPSDEGAFDACCSEGVVATEYQCKANPGCVAAGLTGSNDCCSAEKDLACCEMGNNIVRVNTKETSLIDGESKLKVTFTAHGFKGKNIWVRFTNAPGSILDCNKPQFRQYTCSDVELYGLSTGAAQTYTIAVPSVDWTNIRVYVAENIPCEAHDKPYVNCAYPQNMIEKVMLAGGETTEMLGMDHATGETEWAVNIFAVIGLSFVMFGAFKHYTSKPNQEVNTLV